VEALFGGKTAKALEITQINRFHPSSAAIFSAKPQRKNHPSHAFGATSANIGCRPDRQHTNWQRQAL
jgi:hypothetical protein